MCVSQLFAYLTIEATHISCRGNLSEDRTDRVNAVGGTAITVEVESLANADSKARTFFRGCQCNELGSFERCLTLRASVAFEDGIFAN